MKSNPVGTLIIIEDKDLGKRGNGEGLAKPLPGQPLLVNHPMNMMMAFSMEAGMGVAIAVGDHVAKSGKTLKALKPVPPLQLKTKLQYMLQQGVESEESTVISDELTKQNRKLVLQPYCYLFGYPNAKLETRILARVSDQDGGIVWEKEVKEVSAEKPIFEADSWSANNGQAIMAEMDRALPVVWEALLVQIEADTM